MAWLLAAASQADAATLPPSPILPPATGAVVVTIDYFFEPDCGDCERIEVEVLPDLEARYQGSYRLNRIDTSVATNDARLVATERTYGIRQHASVNMLVNGHDLFSGVDAIRQKLYPLLDRLVSTPEIAAATTAARPPTPHRDHPAWVPRHAVALGLVGLVLLAVGVQLFRRWR